MIVITALPIIREASSNPCSGLETKSGSIQRRCTDKRTHPYLIHEIHDEKCSQYQLVAKRFFVRRDQIFIEYSKRKEKRKLDIIFTSIQLCKTIRSSIRKHT